MKVCKSCGNEVKDGVRFCSSCGSEVEPDVASNGTVAQDSSVRVCKSCGKEVKDGVRFCSACGLAVDYGTESKDTTVSGSTTGSTIYTSVGTTPIQQGEHIEHPSYPVVIITAIMCCIVNVFLWLSLFSSAISSLF